MSHTSSQTILCMKPNWLGTGLCNQLFFIISTIIIAHQKKIPMVSFDDFRLEPMTDKMRPLGNIIDLYFLNQISQKYKVEIFEKKNIKFKLLNVTFGMESKQLDVTKIIQERFVKNNELFIPCNTKLNDLEKDPCPGQSKKLFIEFSLNDKVFKEIHNENLYTSIDINHYHLFQSWNDVDINTHDSLIFDEILEKLQFHKKYNFYIHDVLDFNNHKKMNVIHLRLENDMNGHMAKENKMDVETYISNLENVYISAIQQFFDKKDMIFLLSYNFENNVVKFLKKQGYNFTTTPKNFFEGREQHAIIDLIIGEKCTGTFIGNWNHQRNVGSSFSYVIGKRIKDSKVKQIYVDLYDIQKLVF